MRDLTGERFGRLTVAKRIMPNDKWNSTRWLCKCECGGEKVITRANLSKGTASCGCLRIESITTHGKAHTEQYKVWEGVKARCNNPTDTNYSYYGGRGIKMCRTWEDDFEKFYDWSLKSGYKKGLTLDRIDNNAGYEPSNCRWVDMKAQQRNKSNSVFVTINGEMKHLAQWAEDVGLKQATIRSRYYKGIRGNKLIEPAQHSNRWHKQTKRV